MSSNGSSSDSVAAIVAYCHRLFKVLILIEPICLPKMGVTLDYSFAHLQGRLRRWELDLKVGGQHGSSDLDSQLESAPEDLGLSIEFQLRALKLHLSRVESLMSSCHQLLLTSEMISSPSEDELLDKNVLSLLDKLNFKLDQISFTLDRLQKFAANLLYHTETGLGLKIIDYRRRHDDSAFNQSVRDYVNTRYPSIRPSQYRSSELKPCSEPTETSCEPDQKTAKDQLAHLHETLVNMILFRHYRKLYERENMEEPLMPLPEKKPSRGSQAMVTVARRASALVDTARQKGSQIAAFATSLNENASDGRQIAVRNWDLRESVLNRNLQQKQANVNRPCTSEENLTCPVCDQVYYSDTLQGENWKRHFIIIEGSTPNARDDRCGEAYSASLCNGSDWKERLRQRHGTEWLPLRVPLFWTCSLCRRVPRMEKASRALMMDALISHMLDAREKIGGQAMQSSIGWTTVFLMPPSETCPICETCHLLDGTTTTPTNGGGGGDGAAAADDDDAQAKKALQEARDVAWKKTEDCIGKHVLEMAVHFARYRRAASDQAVAVAAAAVVPDTNMERAEKMALLARKGFRKAAKRLSTVTQGIRS